jgi:Ca2+-dependent lipid-binding protein
MQSSRTAADFSVEIFDWNQIEQAKSLGTAKIDLAPLEPFQSSDLTLPLVSAKHGDKGTVHMRLVFHPGVIAKSRKNTSTFNSAGRALTQIGGLPMGATKGVFQGVTGVFKKEKDFANGGTSALQPVADGLTGQSSHPVSLPDTLGGGTAAAFPSVDNGKTGVSHEPGTLRLTVIGAKDLGGSDLKPYVTIRLADKEVKTKHAKSGHPEWY